MLGPERFSKCPLPAILSMAFAGLTLVLALAAPAASAPPCGTWEPIDAPIEPADSTRTWMNGIKVFAEDDVWAVGDYEVDLPGGADEDYTLIQHWDGTSWTITPSPSPGLDYDGGTECFLYAVDGVAPDDVWAVGAFKTQNVAGHVGWQALTLHWDGSSWEQVEAPFSIPHTSGGFLYSIVAIASDDVWAAGIWPSPLEIGIDAFMLHWDGSSWEVVSTPRVDYEQEIRGMAARGPDDIWAVGGSHTNRNTSYVLHWDGSSWDTVDVPDASPFDWLTDVTLLDNGEIWISTDDIIAGPSYYTHFDGSGWSNVEAPVQAWTIEAIAPDDVWSAGWDGYAHWDGSTWTMTEAFSGRRVHDMDGLGGCDLFATGFDSFGAPPVERLTPDVVTSGFDITLTPVSITVRPGERIEYDVTVENLGSTAAPCTVWIDVFKPNGNPWPGNPLVGPKTATLDAGQVVTRRLSARVPNGTPPSGPYTMSGSIGVTLGDADATSSFTFDVVE